MKALSGTGCASVGALLAEPLPPPPPLEEPPVARVVPLAEVFALEEAAVCVLAVESTFDVPVSAAPLDSEPVDVALEVRLVLAWLLLTSADVPEAAVPVPLVAEEVSVEVDAPPPPEPAPADDPCVAEATAATVPVVEACT